MTNYVGTAGNDRLVGGSGGDSFDISQGGADTVLGRGLNDTIRAGGALTADDRIDGGDNIDRLLLDGDYSAGLVFADETVKFVESVDLAAGHSYDLTLAPTIVLSEGGGIFFQVYGGDLDPGDSVTVDGAAADSRLSLWDGAGDDLLAGGALSDSIYLFSGGEDTVSGGAGDDEIDLGGAFGRRDHIDGGDGADLVYLDTESPRALTLSAAAFADVESFRLTGGWTVRVLDDLAGPGIQPVTLSAFGFDATRIDASREKGSALWFVDSYEDDVITGGGGADRFDLVQGADTISGGKGADTFLTGAYSSFVAEARIEGGKGDDTLHFIDGPGGAGVLVMQARTIVGVENILIDNAVDITFNDGNVAAGAKLSVVVQDVEQNLVIDGSAEKDGRFSMQGSFGDDSLIGGKGADTLDGGHSHDSLVGGAGDDVLRGGFHGDTLTGGAGADRFLFVSVDEIMLFDGDRITDITAQDVIDLRQIDANTGKAGDQAFKFAEFFSGKAGELVVDSPEGSGLTFVQFDIDGDGVPDGSIVLDGEHADFSNFVL